MGSASLHQFARFRRPIGLGMPGLHRKGTAERVTTLAVPVFAYLSIPLAALALAGCAAATAGNGPAPAAEASLPAGSRLSASGYLTILEAPASPFPDDPPPEPRVVDDFARRVGSPDPAVRAKAWGEANGSRAFQAELQRLRQLLSREEPDNFVDVRLVRDPAVAAEFWFKRDAAQTLARHTSNPLFRPRQGGLTRAELERLQSIWASRAAQGELINLVGIDPFTGVVQLGVAVEEAEFRRVAAERGWNLGPEVQLSFPRPRPAAFADPSLAKYVRAYARETKAKGVQLTGGYSGRIVLDDGCLRLSGGKAGAPGPLVLFGRETQLALDQQGHLIVLGEEGQRRYRIGELGSWPGPNTVDEDDPEVRELRRRCGGGPITNVAEPQSERLFSLPYAAWVADYARGKSLSYGEAWDEVVDCLKREERRGRKGLDARDRCIRQFN